MNTSTSSDLLSTKLTAPYARAAHIQRPRLFKLLNAGLEGKLTLVSAPAGFGKTTLVGEWAAQHAPLPVAWVSLDSGDNDPYRFWRYVLAACQMLYPMDTAALDLLNAARPPSFESMLTTFINELARLPERGIMILEDYHVIHLPVIHEAMTFLLEHLPPSLHLVLITRAEPPLPLARLRAHGEMHEIHAEQLYFTLEETETFLQKTLASPLTPETLARIHARIEGWPTGLRLLALALQGHTEQREIERIYTTFSGTHRHIFDYFEEDVLATQPEALQTFFLQTSILTRLHASLCDAVTDRADSAQLLEKLEQSNLFLLPLDDKRQWYRYYALFAEAMQHIAQRRLGTAELCKLYTRASHWYEEQKLYPEAIEAALAAGNVKHAAVMIERHFSLQQNMIELHTRYRWLRQIPAETLQEHPNLCLLFALAMLYTLDRSSPAILEPVEQVLSLAEPPGEPNEFTGAIESVRAQIALWQGNEGQAIAYAHRALAHLPEDAHEFRCACLIIIGTEQQLQNRYEEARAYFLQAREASIRANNPYSERATISLLASSYQQEGKLHTADQLYHQVIEAAQDDVSDQAQAFIGLASIFYEWNELEAAEQYISQALDLGREYGPMLGERMVEEYIIQPATLLQAQILYARGEHEAARELLTALHPHSVHMKPHLLLTNIDAIHAQIAFVQGDTEAIRRISATRKLFNERRPFLQQEEIDFLIMARLLLMQQRAQEVLALIEARPQAQALESQLRLLLLKTLAYVQMREQTQARQTLLHALELAREEGFQRIFLNEGEALKLLLSALSAELRDKPLATYVRTLQQGFTRLQPTEQRHRTNRFVLIEPLSAQEKRVLHLLAANLSNPEIARELVVSINTIKTQVKSIFRKLNVNSRKEAIEVARQTGLLSL
uniref:LuxR family transcriptional regulator n=1 Tax=Thermosporothrix sp. COM3 TaxID=2490863 RepID=A0A455SM06_9CHLR|nr:LuxR family transcriptional regulator [Thermosporothrix sp. COM3]